MPIHGAPVQVYLTCMELLSRLAGKGLIHCDFNEFNLLVHRETEEVSYNEFYIASWLRVVGRAGGREAGRRISVECA
jgi:RIO-like serine/threonine protein kinase